MSGNEEVEAQVIEDMGRLREALRQPAGRLFFSVNWDGAVTELHPDLTAAPSAATAPVE
jgi:hypothetical protein